ncbi:histone-like nucleoid-structuring protein Lsr2 [Actinophytocola sp.]|uniref:histone-like nucleoid-structuring protein Lsr2 n=1 Tax=Actinophytocola sp. TaxID=1872138 RepID=UPI003D6B50F4
MAQQVLVQLVDDLDGNVAEDVETVQFGLDGVTYEIDLSDSHAGQLRDSLVDYIAHGRRTGGRVKRSARSVQSIRGAASGEAGQIREWAQANGIELAARGRIPRHVVDAYRQAQVDEKAAATKNGASRRRSRAK